MCDTCGCNVTPGNKHLVENKGKLSTTSDGKAAVDVLQNLLSENDHQAMHNREHFDKHQVLAINLMSSPGSGKTALLEATIDALGDEFNIAVIEGDLETENDAERIRAKGITAIQIATRTWYMMPCTIWIWLPLISCLSKTSVTWCARRVLIWAIIAM